MARAALTTVQSEPKPQSERFSDVNSGLAEFNRDLRRAVEEFKYNVKTVNLDNAGPMNVDKRRKLYQDPIKSFRKAAMEAFDRLTSGML